MIWTEQSTVVNNKYQCTIQLYLFRQIHLSKQIPCEDSNYFAVWFVEIKHYPFRIIIHRQLGFLR